MAVDVSGGAGSAGRSCGAIPAVALGCGACGACDAGGAALAGGGVLFLVDVAAAPFPSGSRSTSGAVDAAGAAAGAVTGGASWDAVAVVACGDPLSLLPRCSSRPTSSTAGAITDSTASATQTTRRGIENPGRASDGSAAVSRAGAEGAGAVSGTGTVGPSVGSTSLVACFSMVSSSSTFSRARCMFSSDAARSPTRRIVSSLGMYFAMFLRVMQLVPRSEGSRWDWPL
jgi:hypothetical protein